MKETTALGAAIAAGIASGVWGTFDELSQVNSENHITFKPHGDETRRSKHFSRWEKAVRMAGGWLSEEDIDLEYDE